MLKLLQVLPQLVDLMPSRFQHRLCILGSCIGLNDGFAQGGRFFAGTSKLIDKLLFGPLSS